MSALPNSTDFTGAAVTEGQFKTAISGMRDFLFGLFGATGTVKDANQALGTSLNGILSKSAAYTVVVADRGRLIDYTTGTFTLTLPAAGTAGDGFTVPVRNSGAGVITVARVGGDLIDGAVSLTLAAGESIFLVCDGTGWKSIGRTVIGVAAGTLIAVTRYTGNATWTKNSLTTKIYTEGMGGGGGGGGGQPASCGISSAAGMGGSGGVLSSAWNASPPSSASVTIGGGGGSNAAGGVTQLGTSGSILNCPGGSQGRPAVMIPGGGTVGYGGNGSGNGGGLGGTGGGNGGAAATGSGGGGGGGGTGATSGGAGAAGYLVVMEYA